MAQERSESDLVFAVYMDGCGHFVAVDNDGEEIAQIDANPNDREMGNDVVRLASLVRIALNESSGAQG